MKKLMINLLQNDVIINIRSLIRKSWIGQKLYTVIVSYLNQNKYEDRFSSLLSNSIEPGYIVWDVGANIGLYTQKFLKAVGASGQVIAIEPAPLSAKLCKDIAEKVVGGSNLLVVESALGSKEGIAKLEVSDEYPTAPTNRLSSNTDGNTVSVPIITGDSLAMKLGSFPNLIKIDVEGFEVEVLKGMTEVLHSPSLKAIFIEVHFKLLEERGDKYGVQNIINILEECQFKVKWIDFSHIMGTRP